MEIRPSIQMASLQRNTVTKRSSQTVRQQHNTEIRHNIQMELPQLNMATKRSIQTAETVHNMEIKLLVTNSEPLVKFPYRD